MQRIGLVAMPSASLADHLELVRPLDVVHLMHDGRRTPHVITEGARLAGDHVVYDVGTTAAFDLPAD